MCDANRINKYTEEILNMDLRDFRQLILEADKDELKDFYAYLYNYFLEKRQKEVLKEHVY